MGQVISVPEAELVAKFEVTPAQIAELRERFAGVTFDTPANYEVGRQALGVLRALRVRVEKTRVDLKVDVLERGRIIDKTAKTFSKMVEDIEDPLLEAKRVVDETEAQRKREAEKAELIALEEAKRVEREAEERRLADARAKFEADKAEAAAKNAEIEAGQRAERERLAADRAMLEAEAVAVADAARRVREADEERARAAREEAARVQAAKAAEAARERLEAIRPERDRVHAFAGRIRALSEDAPGVQSEMCKQALAWAVGRLVAVAGKLDEFDGGR